MAVVISSLLVVVLLTLALSSGTQQQNFLPGNTTELILSSTKQMISKSSFSPELFKHQIKDKKSYKSSKKEPNKFTELTKKMKKWLKTKDEKVIVEHLITIPGTPTPFINEPFPSKTTFPDDGCGSTSVRFNDGNCYPLMGRKPCGDPTYFVTVDPVTYKGLYVNRTDLCHDIYDRSECEGGRRLYYSQYGDTVCDCPIGEFPFPYPHDDCIPLFTQGLCPYGQVVAISPSGYLNCMTSKCPIIYENDKYSSKPWQKQLVPTSDGRCHELGSDDGPCSNNADTLFGLDILKNQLECIDVTDPTSPYFFSKEENDLLDNIYSEFSPEYSLFHIYTAYQSLLHVQTEKDGKKKAPKETYQRQFTEPTVTQTPEIEKKNSGETTAIPITPSCRPDQKGNKCVNKLASKKQNSSTKKAVSPKKSS